LVCTRLEREAFCASSLTSSRRPTASRRPSLDALEAELPPERLAAVRLAAAEASLDDLVLQALDLIAS
jgi:hypothetical protein